MLLLSNNKVLILISFLVYSQLSVAEINFDQIVKEAETSKGKGSASVSLSDKVVKEAWGKHLEIQDNERKHSETREERRQEYEEQSAQRSSNKANDATSTAVSNATKKEEGSAISERNKTLKEVKDNGKFGGYPSYMVVCTGGSRRAIVRKNGRWLDLSSIPSYIGYEGSKYDSMSVSEIGSYLCREILN